MRRRLWGPLLVGILTLVAVAQWSYVFATYDDDSSSAEAVVGVDADGDSATRMVVLGDAWSTPTDAGATYADVAADQLGWEAQALPDGAGTGFLSRGPTESGTFLEHLRRATPDDGVDVLLVQGGLADRSILQANPTVAFSTAVRRTLRVAATTYPGARVVLLGPAPTDGKRPDPELQLIDDTLAMVADRGEADYISPIEEQWLAGRAATDYLDPTSHQPTEEGHAYLGKRLAQDLEDLEDLSSR